MASCPRYSERKLAGGCGVDTRWLELCVVIDRCEEEGEKGGRRMAEWPRKIINSPGRG